MKDVLRRPVFDARNDAVEVFHRERESSPVMRFELGHRDDEIRSDDRLRKIQMLERTAAEAIDGIECAHVRKHEIVEIEVNERHLIFRCRTIETGAMPYVVGVRVVPGAFSDDYMPRTEIADGASRRRDHLH